MEELKQKVKAAIEKYHQEHYWDIFPSGIDNLLRSWVVDAVAKNIVKPMQEEIDNLKAK